MKIPAAVRKGWEHRFPGLTGKWTHWKITGDDMLLAVVEGSRLTDALDLIEKRYGQFYPSRYLVQPRMKNQN